MGQVKKSLFLEKYFLLTHIFYLKGTGITWIVFSKTQNNWTIFVRFKHNAYSQSVTKQCDLLVTKTAQLVGLDESWVEKTGKNEREK